jgi:hypothetical protein
VLGEVRVVERGRHVRHQSLGELIRELQRVARAMPRLCRRCADGDVVGMTVATVGSKREDGCRPEFADRARQFPDEDLAIRRRQPAIAIVQASYRLHAEARTRESQLLIAHLRDRAPGGDSRIPDLPCLAAGRGDDHDLGAPCRVAGERTSRAEGLVIRMRVQPEETHLTARGGTLHPPVDCFVTHAVAPFPRCGAEHVVERNAAGMHVRTIRVAPALLPKTFQTQSFPRGRWRLRGEGPHRYQSDQQCSWIITRDHPHSL